MADQPRQPACFLKTCNTEPSVFSRSRQEQHIERCTVLKNRRLHEVGKRYRRSAIVSRMTVYFLIVEPICYVAITGDARAFLRKWICPVKRESETSLPVAQKEKEEKHSDEPQMWC
jgi:hypothetical protein